jgi:hypothetical protein
MRYEVRLSRTEFSYITVEAENVESAYAKTVDLIEESTCVADFVDEWDLADGITIGGITPKA